MCNVTYIHTWFLKMHSEAKMTSAAFMVCLCYLTWIPNCDSFRCKFASRILRTWRNICQLKRNPELFNELSNHTPKEVNSSQNNFLKCGNDPVSTSSQQQQHLQNIEKLKTYPFVFLHPKVSPHLSNEFSSRARRSFFLSHQNTPFASRGPQTRGFHATR